MSPSQQAQRRWRTHHDAVKAEKSQGQPRVSGLGDLQLHDVHREGRADGREDRQRASWRRRAQALVGTAQAPGYMANSCRAAPPCARASPAHRSSDVVPRKTCAHDQAPRSAHSALPRAPRARRAASAISKLYLSPG